MKKVILFLVMAFVSAGASAQWGGWDEDISSNSKSRNEALKMANVIPGTVIGVRKVQVTPSNSARATGGAIGTVAGVAVARQVDDSDLGTVVGGLAGGLIAQGMTPAEEAHEVMVRYFSPSRKKMWTIAITTKETFAKGEDVYLIQDANGVRVARY